MKKNTTIICFFLTLSIFSQSPWTKEKGAFYTQLSFTSIANYNSFFGNPDYSIDGQITDNTLQFYGEYGISNKTTFLLNLPLKSISYQQNLQCLVAPCPTIQHDKTAIGNIEIGIKHNFIQKKWLLSGQLAVETNTSTFDNSSGIRTGYNAYTFTPLLLAGKSFGKTYVQSFIGGNFRTNNYISNFKIGGEIGRKITTHIWLIGFLDVSKSLENGTIEFPNSNNITSLYVNDQEYGAFGLKGIGEFSDKFGVTTGFGSVFFGNNLPKRAAFTFGAYHKF